MTTYRTQDGSIPLVLLAAIVVGGLIIALFIDVRTGTRLASDDRDFNQAVQVADAGIQEAFMSLAALPDDQVPENLGEWLFDAADAPTGTLASGTYSWNAVRVGDDQWEVRAEGVVGGAVRVLEAHMGPLMLFAMAAFGDEQVWFNGGNAAHSYPQTGRGYVGSNGLVNLNGNARVDGVTLHGGALYDGQDDNIRNDGLPSYGPEQPLPNIGLTAFGPEGECAGVDPEANISELLPLVQGQTYCVAQADFPGGQAHLIEEADPAVVTAADDDWDPTVRIFVAVGGDLHVQGQGDGSGANHAATVNMERADADGQPDASALEIYLAGGSVQLNNHTMIAAGIYGSNTSCAMPSNAQADVFGSIVCRDIVNQGGWEFHYDERLQDVKLDHFSIRTLREEPGGTTSFTDPADLGS